MKYTSSLITLFLVILSSIIILVGYRFLFFKPEAPLFTTQPLKRRTIIQKIDAAGFIEAEDMMKVGSLVPGIIQKLYVEENDIVEKGDILALIDNGKAENEINQKKAAYLADEAEYIYQKSLYERKKMVFDSGHLSADEIAQATRSLHRSEQSMLSRKAEYEQALLTYENTKIRAPENGIIVGKNSTEGETVALTAPATVIYTIAKDLSKMEVKVEVDETSIGFIKEGMEVEIIFDAYPYETVTGTITEVSNNAIEQGTSVSYRVTVPIKNPDNKYRPGMSLNALISIAHKDDVLAITNQVIAINPKAIEYVAQQKGYGVLRLPEQKRLNGRSRIIWLFNGTDFIEHAIELGISDEAYFEVVGEIPEGELVIDTIEVNDMNNFFSRFFNTGLN